MILTHSDLRRLYRECQWIDLFQPDCWYNFPLSIWLSIVDLRSQLPLIWIFIFKIILLSDISPSVSVNLTIERIKKKFRNETILRLCEMIYPFPDLSSWVLLWIITKASHQITNWWQIRLIWMVFIDILLHILINIMRPLYIRQNLMTNKDYE